MRASTKSRSRGWKTRFTAECLVTPPLTASRLLPGALALCLALGGCATPQPTWQRTGDPVVDGRSAIALGPEKDRVLWQYRTGLAALRRGNVVEAKANFDAATQRISAIYGPDRAAKKARGYFNEEAKKTFIGEPYERSMAWFYLGVIYWMQGEPDNARACFRSGQLEDSDTDDKTYSGDFVTFDYLDSLATKKLRGDGSDAFKRAQASFKKGQLSPPAANANVLFLLEFGNGPAKYATGQYSEQLRIREGRSLIHGAWIKVSGRSVRVYPVDDINFQATTRGGRAMDHILANKAVFKSTADNVGNVALLGGAVLASNRDTQAVGLGLLAAGLIGKAVSAATTPKADTRAWDNLPQYISFAQMELPPGQHTGTVEFLDNYGNIQPSQTKSITFNVPPVGDAVLFVSDRKS